MAHARAGATKVAHALLDRCDVAALSPALRVDALSLRGRLWKDAFHRRPDAAGAARLLERARAQYVRAYEVAHDPYPGINAATLAMLAGDPAAAAALGREVANRLGTDDGSVWAMATRAELHLLQGDLASAASGYAQACERAAANAGIVASMRRQVALLARVLPPAAELLPLLRVPDVVAFAGHLIDAPDRDVPRFPRTLAREVRDAIGRHLASLHAPIVFSSAACGADLLFVEAALANGAEVNVVLPFARADFVSTSVAVGGDEWVARFDDALRRASRVVMVTDEQYLGDDLLFEYGARLVEGLARLRAQQLETAPSMLCAIDLDAGGDIGGTRASYERWRASGARLDVVDLAAIRRKGAPHAASSGFRRHRDAAPAKVVRLDAPQRGRSWKALMFADVAGFSRVQDAHAPRFHERFLALGARAIEQSRARPLDAKTWGDGLYVVFDRANDAADFALRFLASAQDLDWSGAGLAGTAGIRIALHAGPVYRGYDPVMQREDFFGSSVTRAARIEPVTQPGTVYASESFAATLAAQRDHAFALEYIGRLPLAKAYGELRIYRVERA